MKKFTLIAALFLCEALLAGCGNYSGSWTSPSNADSAAAPKLHETSFATQAAPTPGPYIGTLPTAPVIVFAGSGVAQSSTLPAQTVQLLAPQKYDFYNESIEGKTTGQMLEAASWAIDAFYRPTRAKNILVVWAGQADLANGASSDQTFENLMNYCQARSAVGFKVVVVTLLPAAPQANDRISSNYEAARQALNSRLRTHWPEFAGALADVAALPVPDSAKSSLWAGTLKTAISNLAFEPH